MEMLFWNWPFLKVVYFGFAKVVFCMYSGESLIAEDLATLLVFSHTRSPRAPRHTRPPYLIEKPLKNTMSETQYSNEAHKPAKSDTNIQNTRAFLQHTRFASLAFFARLWKVNHVIFCSKHFTRSMSYLCYKNWIPISRLRRLFPKILWLCETGDFIGIQDLVRFVELPRSYILVCLLVTFGITQQNGHIMA